MVGRVCQNWIVAHPLSARDPRSPALTPDRLLSLLDGRISMAALPSPSEAPLELALQRVIALQAASTAAPAGTESRPDGIPRVQPREEVSNVH